MLSTVREFNHKESINYAATTRATVAAIAKPGQHFNIAEVFFALDSQNAKVDEKKIRRYVNEYYRKLNYVGWYIRPLTPTDWIKANFS